MHGSAAVRAKLKPGDVLVADANTGWLMHDAARVVRAVKDVDVYIEQPCLTYEECLAIRRRTDHPFVLDESIDSLEMLLRAHAEGAMDVVNLKISKVGGLTKARQIRDLCVWLGIAMTIEDSGAATSRPRPSPTSPTSTPEELRFSATDFNSYVTRQHGQRRPAPAKRSHGRRHDCGPGHRTAPAGPRQARARGKGAAALRAARLTQWDNLPSSASPNMALRTSVTGEDP